MTSNTKNRGKIGFWIVFGLTCFGILLGLLLSLGVAEGVHKTSDAKFCISCHSMKPMIDSYREDLHGGKNKNGFKVECVACHLPHDNTVQYLYQKVATSIHDIRVEWFGDMKSIDWEEKRKHASSFVYDSGCIKCHSRLQEATSQTPKGFIAHRDYFAKTIDKKCTNCHNNVGHHNLGNYLKEVRKER